jgi:hypothetical protein
MTMAAKGFAPLLRFFIIIAIIVSLVTAFILLTVFRGSTEGYMNIADAHGFCATQGTSSCSITQQLPPSWGALNVQFLDSDTGESQTVSCHMLIPNARCEGIEFVQR